MVVDQFCTGSRNPPRHGARARGSGGAPIGRAAHRAGSTGSQGDALLVASILPSGAPAPFRPETATALGSVPRRVGTGYPTTSWTVNPLTNPTEFGNIRQLASDLEDEKQSSSSQKELATQTPNGGRQSTCSEPQHLSGWPQLARVRHVLPIRTAGFLAILEAAPSTDLLFLNHVGVHDFRSLGDLWRNVPFPVPLRFHATRSARNEVPDADTLVDWLDARWEDFDTWVATNTPEPSGSATGS
ncbi:MAG: hypothetical protein CM1200mP26_30420 [Acidimicrobiales bacterium]|nr:MAG: hypothetical protein CM1200mP26_30420 [Acidimicrobiales bacterium]